MSGLKRKHSSEDNDGLADCYGPVVPCHLLKNTESGTTNVSADCTIYKEPTVETIGPVLPPHLQKESSNSVDQDSCERDTEKKPKSNVIGPILPSHFTEHEAENSEDKDDRSLKLDAFGPALPINLKKELSKVSEDLQTPQQYQRVLGPSLPPHLIKLTQPQLNSDNNDEYDEDSFGPLPPEARLTEAHIALEERALHMKMKQLEPNQDIVPVREEWMLELPEVKASNLGLGPRQFRSKSGPDMSDRSSWTKVAGKSKPSQKEIKVDLKKEAEVRELERRDKEQEKMAKKHKKKDKSLLESHQDKLKEKKKDEGLSERRPFSREIDLQVNRFDEAQKKAVLKKAELLDDRFSSGQAKFL